MLIGTGGAPLDEPDVSPRGNVVSRNANSGWISGHSPDIHPEWRVCVRQAAIWLALWLDRITSARLPAPGVEVGKDAIALRQPPVGTTRRLIVAGTSTLRTSVASRTPQPIGRTETLTMGRRRG